MPGYVGCSSLSPELSQIQVVPILELQEIHVSGMNGWRQDLEMAVSQKSKWQQGANAAREAGGAAGRLRTRRLWLMAVDMPKVGAVLGGEMEPKEDQSLSPGSDQMEREMQLQHLWKP